MNTVFPFLSLLARDLSMPTPVLHGVLSLFCFAALLLTAGTGDALELEEPVDGPFGGMARVTLETGEVLEVPVSALANAQNGIASLLYRQDGKHRLSAEEVQTLEVDRKTIGSRRPAKFLRRLPGWGLKEHPTARLKVIDETYGTQSVDEYWDQIVPKQDEQRRFFSMQQDNGDTRLVQILNRGFDTRIQVVRKPIPIAGSFLDMEKERFWVIKDDGTPMQVDKKRYVAAFVALFGDCDVTKAYSKKERKFRHFAEHLFVYDRHCPAATP